MRQLALSDYGDTLYGRLRVLSIHPERSKWGSTKLNCICTCGVECVVISCDLRQGKVRSCGCLKAEFGKSDNQIWRKRALAEHGCDALRHRDPWLIKAQWISRRCKSEKLEFGFASGQDLARYLIDLNVTHCPVFGFELRHSTGYAKFDTPSVDRKKADGGYTRDNIQIVSYLANTMKSNATDTQLIAFAKWILNTEARR